ncbi:sulfite exporter TauE/SafE family protein [Hirschia litorea]|uniref:Probable membrane transporter protein n=1 Tax=Hirschia litorea TaxID=1199156 RepID=A0ABW2IIU7_9PROT
MSTSLRILTCISVAIIAGLFLAYGLILDASNLSASRALGLWSLPVTGVIGAIIASASGTGGGVVFIPIFNSLNEAGLLSLSQTNIVAASFLIQCFGMTMGSLVWLRGMYASETVHAGIPIKTFWKALLSILAIALPVMLFTQWYVKIDPKWVLFGFKVFSITLGSILVFNTLQNGNTSTQAKRTHLEKVDFTLLLLVAPIGGFANALFSVGLGEIVALYLFLRGYSIVTSTGMAVIISAFSVLSGAPYHIYMGNVPWEVVAMTAPGALLGGFLARGIALRLQAYWLKLAAGSWIALSGIGLLLMQYN